MERERTFPLTVLFVTGLLACTVTLGVTGGLAALLESSIDAEAVTLMRIACAVAFAGIVGFACAVAQVATASAQMLSGRPEHRVAFWLAVACACLCALVSWFGVDLGGNFLNGHAAVRLDPSMLMVAGLGLGFVKPAMSYVREACRACERERVGALNAASDAAHMAHEAGQRQAEREASLERDRIRASAPAEAPADNLVKLADRRPPRPAKARQPARAGGGGRAAAALAAGATALAGGGILPADANAAPVAIEQTAEGAVEHRRPSIEEIDDARLILARQNAAEVAQGREARQISQRTVAAQIKVRRYDVEWTWRAAGRAGQSIHFEL